MAVKATNARARKFAPAVPESPQTGVRRRKAGAVEAAESVPVSGGARGRFQREKFAVSEMIRGLYW